VKSGVSSGRLTSRCPDEWEATIAALLSKMAEHRPQSAREVLRALGLQSSGHAKTDDYDEQAVVMTQAAPEMVDLRRESSIRQRPISPAPAEDEMDDNAAATVVPHYSPATEDPALAHTIPPLRQSGTFPPIPMESAPPHPSYLIRQRRRRSVSMSRNAVRRGWLPYSRYCSRQRFLSSSSTREPGSTRSFRAGEFPPARRA
jgi:hypothetical protein